MSDFGPEIGHFSLTRTSSFTLDQAGQTNSRVLGLQLQLELEQQLELQLQTELQPKSEKQETRQYLARRTY
ncbi:hypothetical protein BH11CYA1_BH11CYA1_47550 [soil metagenome]